MRGRIAGALIALACAAGAAKAADAPDFKATSHTVAILSLLGDTLQQANGDPIATPGADFDNLAERAMASQMASDLPSATVVRVGGPREPLLQQMYPRTGFGDVGLKNVQRELREWAVVHSADYIVILRKTVGVVGDEHPYLGMTSHWTLFGIGVSDSPYAFLSIEVLDGKSLDVVAELSVRDMRWGTISYEDRHEPTPEHLPMLVNDTRAMLASIVPGLTHGVGL